MLSYDGLKMARDSCCTLDTIDIHAIPEPYRVHIIIHDDVAITLS